MKISLLKIQKILTFISIISGVVCGLLFIDRLNYILFDAFHILPWEYWEIVDRIRMLGIVFASFLLTAIICGIASFIMAFFIKPKPKWLLSLTAPLIVLAIFLIIKSTFPKRPDAIDPTIRDIRNIRIIVLGGKIDKEYELASDFLPYMGDTFGHLWPVILEKYTKESIEKLSTDAQLDETIKWLNKNKYYLYFEEPNHKLQLDQEAKAAGIPTKRYRQTYPWPQGGAK